MFRDPRTVIMGVLAAMMVQSIPRLGGWRRDVQNVKNLGGRVVVCTKVANLECKYEDDALVLRCSS